MSRHYFVHQAIDGHFHVVFRMLGCGSLHSVGDAPTEQAAQRLADEFNRGVHRDGGAHE
ncbi:MAG: hypothetical protein JOY60_12670 [Burkholderiaceae bacterium]|nr:hypothetical protein [Burkholderiaceae bacterium]